MRPTRHATALAVLLFGCSSPTEEPPTEDAGEGGSAGAPPVDGGAVLLCPPGELSLDDGSCVPPGIEACAEGFSSDGQRACLPILPAALCATGLMAVPGDETCRPVATCGSGPYEGIPVEPTMVYVDPTYAGGSSDGSLAMPYVSLVEGLAAAADGAIVALAPGTYGPVVLDRPVRVWASCPDAVTFEATTGAAIRIEADGVELHRLAVTGRGVVVSGAKAALLSEVHLHDIDNAGLVAESAAEVTLASSLVERATGPGLRAAESTLLVTDSEIRDGVPSGSGDAICAVNSNAEATMNILGSWLHHGTGMGINDVGGQMSLERSVVSDNRSTATGNNGTGLWVRVDQDGLRGQVELRDVVIERNKNQGVVVQGAELDAERLTIRDTVTHDASTASGRGMRILSKDGVTSSVRLSQTVVERSQYAGIFATQADLDIETTIVRDVDPHPVTNDFGIGLVASSRFGLPSSLILRGLAVERTSTAGLLISGSTGDVEGVLVREARPVADGGHGFGVAFTPGIEDALSAQGSARQIVIEDAVTVGLMVMLSDVEAEHVIVRNSRPSTLGFGDGIAVSGTDPNITFLTGSAQLQASKVTVEGSERAGFAVFSATASVAQARLLCNDVHLNIETIEGADEASLQDAGGNHCGCEDEPEVCKVQSSGLTPPSVN